MELTEELLALLRENGAVLAAAGDMRGVENCAYPAGVAAAIPMPRDIVRSLPDAPSREYLAAYPEINAVLDAAVSAGKTGTRLCAFYRMENPAEQFCSAGFCLL